MVFKIERWDPSHLPPHPRILIVGRSGSGKSVALLDVLSHLASQIDLCLFFSPTTDSLLKFQQHAPAGCIHPGGLKLDLVEEALRMNRSLAEKNKQRELFIVADDVAAMDKKLLASPVMRDAMMNGRHAKCGWALCLQYCMDVPVDCRSQFQVVIVCAENNQKNRRRIWEQFGGVVPTYREWDAIFTSCTHNHSCLVIDTTNPSATIQTSIFHWKARVEPPPYKLCRPVFWKLDAKRPQDGQKSNVLVVEPPRPTVDKRTMAVVG